MTEDEIQLIDYLRIIIKKRWLIIGGTVFFMVTALVISLFLPKSYQTSLQLKIGEVWGKSIENHYRVAEIINSEPFIYRLKKKMGLTESLNQIKRKKSITAEIIEAGGTRDARFPILVRIVSRGSTPNEAVRMSTTVADLVIKEHLLMFDELMKEHHLYESKLEKQIQVIQLAIDELDETIKGQRKDPKVSPPAVILLQAQLEQKQSQLLGIIRELRDVKINNTSRARTQNTRVVLPPAIPEDPVNPKITFNVLIAGVIGLISMLMLAFFLEYIGQVKQREQNPKES